MGERYGGELAKGKEEVGRWGLRMGPGMGGREKGGKGEVGRDWSGKGNRIRKNGEDKSKRRYKFKQKKKRAGEGIFFYFFFNNFSMVDCSFKTLYSVNKNAINPSRSIRPDLSIYQSTPTIYPSIHLCIHPSGTPSLLLIKGVIKTEKLITFTPAPPYHFNSTSFLFFIFIFAS